MYTPRYLEDRCRKALADGKVLVITGARQTGKTTLARRLLAEAPEGSSLGLSLDDPFLRDRLVGAEGGLIREIEEHAGRPWSSIGRFHLLLDEVQKAPLLIEIVKAMHDSWPERLDIILTGSSALEMHDPVAESLAGRARLLHLHPFTLSEGLAHSRGEDPTKGGLARMMARLLAGRFDGSDFDALVERARWHAADRRRFTEDHLRFPLFPEPSVDAAPEEWIRDYLATYIEKDVRSMATVGSLGLFRACIRQIAARTGNPVKWETMAQEAGTTSITLRRYAGLMEQAMTVARLAPFAVNPVKRVVRAQKLYPSDAGLLWGLRGFEDRRLLEASGMLGVFMELAAVMELLKWCSFEASAPEAFFWSKTSVSEVDLLITNRGFHIPFEIKLGRQFDRSWLRGLDAFEADHKAIEVPYRVVLHMGEPARPDPRTYVIPLWSLA